MRKYLVFVLVAALATAMTAGVAQAKGKPDTKPAKKTPQVVYNFTGQIASVDELTGSVTVDVEGANKAARDFAGQQVTFATSATTIIDLDDVRVTLAELEAGQPVHVQAKDVQGQTTFTARVISAETAPEPAPETEPETEPEI